MQKFAEANRGRTTLRVAVIYATSVALVVCLLRDLKHRGGPFFKTPPTVDAHTWPATHDVIMLCKRVRAFIPSGASVTVIRPSQAPNYEATLFLAAVGNLPRQRVVAPHMEPGGNAPQYVIAVREPLSDLRYEKFAEFAEGTIWRRKP